MNKKVLMVALTLMLLAIPLLTIIPVQAGKGTDKLYYEMNVTILDWNLVDVRTAPPEAPPNVVFLTLSEAYSEDFILQIGSYTFTPDRSAEVKVIIYTYQPFVLTKISETYTFDGVDGTIEISATGRVNNYGTPEAMSDIEIVGHGTGYFKGVKISAEGWNEPGNAPHKIHIGTIMGWPGLP